MKEFNTAEEAKDYIKSQEIWKVSSSRKTSDGLKVEYRCTKGLYRLNECPAGLSLLYHSVDLKVSMFETGEHENHNSIKSTGLDDNIKAFIKEQYKSGIEKPNAILNLIKKNNLPEPPKPKLIAYLKNLRSQKDDLPTIEASQFIEWCSERQVIPESLDTPFVLKQKITCEFSDSDPQDIKIVLSTKRLLENLKKNQLVQIDETKLIWQGYPILIIGTSDNNQVFHPFAIGLTKTENSDDFAFIFEALHSYDLNWQPKILLADANEAITKGFAKIFEPPEIRLMCFSHVLKNLEKHFKTLNCNSLKDDIIELQTCKNKNTFIKATQLFLEKWKSIEGYEQIKIFIKYFNSEWIEKNSNWYEGIAIGYPSTNNGLESISASLKKEHTLREKLPVKQFLNNVVELLSKWSLNCKKFSEVKTISLKEWTSGYEWVLKNKNVLRKDIENGTNFYVTSSNSDEQLINEEMLENYLELQENWSSFEEFKKLDKCIWTIFIKYDNLDESSCTCLYFMKNLTCKHVLGMKIKLNLVTVPNEVKPILVGQKRKRGRPLKTSKAIIV